jgi:cytochrome oxidase Cu insertion factor (SCO1/SenC/PrrC family)
MGSSQKIIVSFAWALVVIAMVGMIAVWATRPESPSTDAGVDAPIGPGGLPMLFPSPDFKLTDQNGDTITPHSFRGNVYVAILFFSRCVGPCPAMLQHQKQVLSSIADARLRAVSFTMDPEFDRPEVLKRKALDLEADPVRWLFLTADDVPTMMTLARNFKLAASPAQAGEDVMHSTQFLLVDAEGMIRGVYSPSEPGELDRIKLDIRKLLATLKR